MNQLMHQDSVTANPKQFTSKHVPILPTPVLWFRLLRGDWIIILLIMVMLRFNFKNIHLNITLTLFQIWTHIWSSQLMMMKWTNYSNYSTQTMMMIFLMSISRCFRLGYWSLLYQVLIQYLMCCLIKTEEKMLVSQIPCHAFLCYSQPKLMWNWPMETWDIPKELGLFYVVLLTVPLYIQWYQFIIVHLTLPTISYWVLSNFMMVLNFLHLNLLKIVILLTLRVILGDHPTRLGKIRLSSNKIFQSQT